MLGEIHRTWLKLKLKITNINKNGKEKKGKKRILYYVKLIYGLYYFRYFMKSSWIFKRSVISL